MVVRKSYLLMTSVVLMMGMLASAALAAQLNVPTQYATIQDAIDAASNGDSVQVAMGTYYENLDFGGKNIFVAGAIHVVKGSPVITNLVTIDGGSNGPCVTFDSGEGVGCSLNYFNLTNGTGNPGTGYTAGGGGIYCYASSPTIQGCVISQCSGAYFGGGINCYNNSHPYVGGTTISYCSAGAGGAIACTYSSSPHIVECKFINNSANSGGGIYCWSTSSPLVERSEISNNAATHTQSGAGGGLYTYSSNPTLQQVLMHGNSAVKWGGGVYCYTSAAQLTNVTSYHNTAYQGGFLYCRSASNPIIRNCIVSDTTSGYAFYNDTGTSLSHTVLSYTALNNNSPGNWKNWTGNLLGTNGIITVDPFFHDPAHGDFHEESQAGHWDVATGTWEIDDHNSLCIDAGDGSDFSSEPDPNGSRINMGAYGNTSHASKSP